MDLTIVVEVRLKAPRLKEVVGVAAESTAVAATKTTTKMLAEADLRRSWMVARHPEQVEATAVTSH